ncbi:MAG: D-alanyl-D-alanine carboxypeptidase family protein [bacterium]
MNRMFLSRHGFLPHRQVLAFLVLISTCLPGAGPARAEGDAGAAAEGGGETIAAGPAVLTGNFKSAYVIDADTGLPLVATNERERRQPASMVKMMTELLVLERVAEGDLSFDDVVRVSAKSSRMGGSQVYLKHGEEFTLRELLMALAIHSANDAAVALAEYLAGSVAAFVDLMNLRAADLGMTDTEFHSVHGLPPGRDQQPDLTSARDMAVLGRELIRHPEALEWSAIETAPFRNGEFTLHNPNKLVGKFRGLDGIKTGYTGPAGFCVTASAVQKGKRLISVVMGCETDNGRAVETTRLLSLGFNMYQQVDVVPVAGAELPQEHPVKGGKTKTVPLVYAEALTVSVPRGREADVLLKYDVPDDLTAPLPAGTEVGRAVAVLDDIELGAVGVKTKQEVLKGNWLNRLFNR